MLIENIKMDLVGWNYKTCLVCWERESSWGGNVACVVSTQCAYIWGYYATADHLSCKQSYCMLPLIKIYLFFFCSISASMQVCSMSYILMVRFLIQLSSSSYDSILWTIAMLQPNCFSYLSYTCCIYQLDYCWILLNQKYKFSWRACVCWLL